MTVNDLAATQAMKTHHAQLVSQVDARARLVETDPTVEATAALLAYLAGEVLPHALAEEASVYRAAAALPGLAPLIGGLIVEHHELARLGDDLSPAAPADVRRAAARRVRLLFADHVGAENDVVLPALRDGAPGSLPALLEAMHEQLSAPVAPPASASISADDALFDLVVQASDELDRAGAPDAASRLLARAWTVLRAPRPDLARRVTSRLHRVARSLEPTAVSIATPSTSAPSDADSLDVRSLPPRERHESIFSAYEALGAGDSFVLVNDHDPKPLRYQFDAEHPGAFTWDYLESGPRVWRVRIGRSAA